MENSNNEGKRGKQSALPASLLFSGSCSEWFRQARVSSLRHSPIFYWKIHETKHTSLFSHYFPSAAWMLISDWPYRKVFVSLILPGVANTFFHYSYQCYEHCLVFSLEGRWRGIIHDRQPDSYHIWQQPFDLRPKVWKCWKLHECMQTSFVVLTASPASRSDICGTVLVELIPNAQRFHIALPGLESLVIVQ